MGERVSAKRVWVNVNGLNAMFNKANLPATRAFIAFLRDKNNNGPYPNLLKKGNKRVGSLWFAASVLTAHFDDYTTFPGDSQRRFIKWLMWLLKEHPTTHDKIIDLINMALKSTNTEAAITWEWEEDKVFDDSGITVVTRAEPALPWTVKIVSVGARLSDIDKKVAEDE